MAPPKRRGLLKGESRKAEVVSERQLPMWIISNITISRRRLLRAFPSDQPLTSIIQQKAPKPTNAMTTEATSVRSTINRLKTRSCGGRDGRCKTPVSPGSKARATSWMPLVTRFNHSNWTGNSGSTVRLALVSGQPVNTASPRRSCPSQICQ